MLARNLVWVGVVHLHRGDTATARRMFDEAWEISGAATLDVAQPFAVHGVLPAHVARVTYLVAVGEHARAFELGRTAVDIADRTGNIAWAVYRLLPTLADAALALGEESAVEEVRRRLVHDASWLAHPIGQAWVGVIDAEAAGRRGLFEDAIPLLQHAVATLEGVPFPHDAALIRLRLAKALHRSGQDGEAAREARAALETFESLKAKPSADHAREMLRTFGARVPVARNGGNAFEGLTQRELDIVRLVARRLSNKEIGARLGISDRTVGTHLANIFGKTAIRDRTLLGDAARERGLHRID
jgi:DNA-binding CsgD family transcriptional regulator